MDPQTIRAYDEAAALYDDETAGFWRDFPASFVSAFAAALGGARVADIGSGPGRDAELLKKAGLEVVCLDASEAMVAMSRSKGFEAVRGDALALPFEDGSFDGAWAYTSLLHLKKADMPRALAELRRILKPGGALALGMIEGSFEDYRQSSGMAVQRFFSFYEKSELDHLLAEAGFEIEHFESFKPSSKAYLNYVLRKR